MSDIDPTPDTPQTIGDRLSWFRGDVNAGIVNLVAAQLALRGTPEATIRDVVLALASLAGEPAGTLGTIQTRLTDIAGELASGPGISLYNLVDLLYIGQADIQTRLDRLQAGLGAVPYEDLEIASTRGLLNAILRTLSVQTNGTPPTLAANDRASDSFQFALGRRFATWNPPVPGATVSSDGYTLTPNTNWDGFSVYVQSNAPDFGDGVAQSLPCNTWVTLSGSAPRAWSVLQQYNIRVYLRPPFVSTVNYYIWSGSDIVQYNTPFGIRWRWSTTKYNDLTFLNFGGANNPYLRKDVGGWSWRITGGAGPQVQYSSTNDFSSNVTTVNNANGTIATGTQSLILQTFTSAPTSIELFLAV